VKAKNTTEIRRSKRKPKAAHRPPLYNKQIAEKVCDKLIMGESLNTICKSAAMPSTVTIYKWLKKYPEFKEEYLLSRDLQMDTYVDMLIDIADDAVTMDDVRKARLKSDNIKWYVGKLKLKRYAGKRDDSNKEHVIRVVYEKRQIEDLRI